MGYWGKPKKSLALWHVAGRSDITQPPMYGHALRVLGESGTTVLCGRSSHVASFEGGAAGVNASVQVVTEEMVQRMSGNSRRCSAMP